MIASGEINLQTHGAGDTQDITAQVRQQVKDSGISAGTVNVFVTGSTAGITTIEFEPGLTADFQKMWERLVPKDMPYEHNAHWGDDNGYAHVRASLLGSALTVPVINKKLGLGTWQQIVLVDFDNRPRNRTIIVQIMGE